MDLACVQGDVRGVPESGASRKGRCSCSSAGGAHMVKLGDRIGTRTVIALHAKGVFEARCDCGATARIRSTGRHTKCASCTPKPGAPRGRDYTGETHGTKTVIGRHGKLSGKWVLRCQCGAEATVAPARFDSECPKCTPSHSVSPLVRSLFDRLVAHGADRRIAKAKCLKIPKPPRFRHLLKAYRSAIHESMQEFNRGH
jgi:hypothetical protein